MANDAEMREWLTAQDYSDVPARGRLSDEWRRIYEDGHNPPPDAGPGDDDLAGVYKGYADSPPETKPSPPKSSGGGGLGARLGFGRSKRRRGGRGKKKTLARVPVDDLISGTWRLAAKLATPMPPVQRTLRMQAPVAGMLLEDVARDTAVDTVLQPLARLARVGETAAALVFPPLAVGIMTLHVQQAAAQGETPSPVVLGVGEEMLREGLRAWITVAGPRAAELAAREREFEETYGATIDELIRWIMSPPADPTSEDAVAAEEEAIKRAQGLL